MSFMSQARALLEDDDDALKINDIPVPDYERRRIEQRALQKEDKLELSDFYVAETDQEREDKAPDYSATELAEIRTRAFQVLKRAPGVFAVKLGALSDWFAVRRFVILLRRIYTHVLEFDPNYTAESRTKRDVRLAKRASHGL